MDPVSTFGIAAIIIGLLAHDAFRRWLNARKVEDADAMRAEVQKALDAAAQDVADVRSEFAGLQARFTEVSAKAGRAQLAAATDKPPRKMPRAVGGR